MAVSFTEGDLFDSQCQTLAHGVNCAGRMGAGIAVEFRRRYPAMYHQYRRRCHSRRLNPGEYFLWRADRPWVLNLATQSTRSGARIDYVEQVLSSLALNYEREGLKSIAMPQIAAGLGGLAWDDVREVIVRVLDPVPIPIVVYERFISGYACEEVAGSGRSASVLRAEPVLFGPKGAKEWALLSNFASTAFVINEREYRTAEHFFQASKAVSDIDHEWVCIADTPREAKERGRSIRLRSDWEQAKHDVMRTALLAKFRQNPEAKALLLSSGQRPIHEASNHDSEWGWMDGEGEDWLGRLLVEIRAILKYE